MTEVEQSGRRIVTPEEASRPGTWIRGDDLLHTVATEPERVRAAVVKALRKLAQARREVAEYGRLHSGDVGIIAALEVEASDLVLDADRIESGAV